MMTKKIYIAFAHILSNSREMVWDAEGYYLIDEIERQMVHLFFADNPNFNAVKFRAAAGLEPEKT